MREDYRIKKILNDIDLYFRATNYLTIAQMYLSKNFNLSKPLKTAHLKKRCAGHWGASPGINFIWAHLNALLKRKKDLNIMLVVGTGHAASAVLANLFLDGTLEKFYPELNNSESGIVSFINKFCSIDGFRSELEPKIPGCICDGGELGYALSISFGAAFDNHRRIVACIIGDGEAETGATAAAWHSNKFLNAGEDGCVLPIINLNGYKMASASIYATMSNIELSQYFRGLGYYPIFVQNDHASMYHGLNKAIFLIEKYFSDLSTKHVLPVIILKSPKGWTGPKFCSGKIIEGGCASHKLPLLDPYNNSDEFEALKAWLFSYHPSDIFNINGTIRDKVVSIVPHDSLLLCHEKYWNIVNPTPFKAEVSDRLLMECEHLKKNTEFAALFLKKIIDEHDSNFRIFSPDELISNGFNALFDITTRRYSWRYSDTDTDDRVSPTGRIMEILNEQLCQGWLIGYTMLGRRGLFISYEAFLPIVTSMLSQYMKFLFQAQKVPWRSALPSLTYILSSLMWSNTYSHQNPDFVSTFFNKEYDFIEAYYPCDGNSMLMCLAEALQSENYVNFIIASKTKLPQLLDPSTAEKVMKDGICVLKESHSTKTPNLILVGIGDVLVNESIKAYEYLTHHFPMISIRCIAVIKLTSIGGKKYKQALPEEKFLKYFGSHIPTIVSYHGYAATVRNLFYQHKELGEYQILGYKEKGDISAPTLYKLIVNNISWFNIVEKSCNLLFKNNNITKNDYNDVINDIDVKKSNYLNLLTNTNKRKRE